MPNLLDRASIVLTPTAYDDSKVLCAKPIDGSGDFDFSRNSAATRVNSQGLVEDVQIIFGDKVTNGNFSNGSTDWILNAWTVANGKASLDGSTGSFLQQNGILVSGKTYKVQYTVSDYVSGNVRFRANGVNGSTNVSNGVVSDLITVNSTFLSIQGFNGFEGSISNISAIETINDTNLPRINYDGFSFDGSGDIISGSGCGSWLWENQSTNLITYSENFNQWANLGGRSTVTLNSIISPDGTINGTKQTQIVANSSVRLRFSSILTIGTEYTFSVFAKKGNHDKLIMNISGVSTNFTLTDNWVRYEITATAPNNTFVDVGISQGSIGDFIYLWGGQAEEQSFATSYIPTFGTSVTRNQDLCTNGGSVSTINSTEGVLYAQVSALTNENVQRTLSLSDGTQSNVVILGFSNSTTDYRFFANVRLGNVNQAFLTFNFGAVAPTFKKVAVKYKQNDFALWIDGVEVATDTSGNTFSANTLNELNFTRGADPQKFFGKTKALAVWKEALTDLELQKLTTI